MPLHKWRYRDPPLGADSALPNDVRRVLRASRRYPTCIALAAVALPAQVRVGGALCERGRCGAADPGYTARRACGRFGKRYYATGKWQ